MPIHAKITALRHQYNNLPTPHALREQALVVYTKKTLEALETALREGVGALQGFLESNWAHVNSTALSPTAIPNADITKLLCDVAEFVAAELNKTNPEKPVTAIKLLMPSVTIDSIRPRLFDDESHDIGEGYKNLPDEHSLEEILKTHILGREGRFLIPVKLLTELGLSAEAKNLVNPYAPDDAAEDLYFVTPEEYARLVAHSPLTQAVCNAHQQYHRLASDKSSLLGQLHELCVKFAINSGTGIGSENDAGAGAYVPISIFNDYYNALSPEQRDSIPELLKQEIEKLLTLASNSEVNINATENLETCIATRRSKLLAAIQGNEAILNGISISGSQRQSLLSASIVHLHKAKEELTRQLDLKSYKSGQDNLGLNRHLLDALEMSFNIASIDDLNVFKALNPNEMIELLKSPSLPPQLINQIPTIENLIILIMELSPEKVIAILSGIKKENFLSITGIRSILISLDPEKCTAVFDAMKSELLNIIDDDLSYVVRYLMPAQLIAVINAIKGELINIVKTKEDLSFLLQNLEPAQLTAVISTMQSELMNIIKTNKNLGYVLQQLAPEQLTAFFDAMKNELPNMLRTDERGLYYVLKPLALPQRIAVLDAIKIELPNIIKTAADFKYTLEDLGPEEYKAVFDAMKNELPNIIKTGDDFHLVLDYLLPEHRTAFIDFMKSELPNIIKTGHDLSLVLDCLPPVHRSSLFDFMKSELPNIIKIENDLYCVLLKLTKEQQITLIDIMKSKLLNIINTSGYLSLVLCRLPPEQHIKVIDVIKSKLSRIINEVKDLNSVLQPLSLEERAVVFDVMISEFPRIIKNAEDLNKALLLLSPEQRARIFDVIKSELSNIIKTCADLNKVLQHLTSEERLLVIDAIKSNLPNLIKTQRIFMPPVPNSLRKTYKAEGSLIAVIYPLQALIPLHRTLVIDAIENELPNMLETIEDLFDFLPYLNVVQSARLVDAIKNELPKIIKRAQDLNVILQLLASPEQRAVIFDVMKNELSKIINTSSDLSNVLKYLTSEQCATVINNLKSELTNIIKTSSDFHCILKTLSTNQRIAIIDAMGSKILGLNNLCGAKIPTLTDELDNIIKFIENRAKKPHAQLFASAVLDNDQEKIKIYLANLAQEARGWGEWTYSIWSRKDPTVELITHIDALSPKWKDRIRATFGKPHGASDETLGDLLSTVLKRDHHPNDSHPSTETKPSKLAPS